MKTFEVFPFTDEFGRGMNSVSEGALKQAVIDMYRCYEVGTFDPDDEDEDMVISAEGLLRDIIPVDRETSLKLMARVLNSTLHYLDGRGLQCEDRS